MALSAPLSLFNLVPTGNKLASESRDRAMAGGGVKMGRSITFVGYQKRMNRVMIVNAARAEEGQTKKMHRGEEKLGFAGEMRHAAMKLHTREQTKAGEREVDSLPVGKWEPTVDGYLKFLVDSKLVYDTLDEIVDKAAYPFYAEFKNTGLERSEGLEKDLQWFKEQGHAIPEPGSPGVSYAQYLQQMSKTDPPAFICHFYNFYFAHAAGGRIIGKKARSLFHKKSN